MKTRYRIIARRQLEAGRQIRRPLGQESGFAASLDDPIEMASEVIDLATGQLAEPMRPKRAKRP